MGQPRVLAATTTALGGVALSEGGVIASLACPASHDFLAFLAIHLLHQITLTHLKLNEK
jgi:hypothetical protein